MEIKEKYKLLAFITLLKFSKKNSILNKKIKTSSFIKELGISNNTFQKYKKLSIDLGYIIPYNNHFKIIKIVDIINDLDININSHNRFFRHVYYQSKTFKSIYETIQESFLLKNFKSQEFKLYKKSYKAEVAKEIISNSKYKVVQDNLPMKRKLEKEACKKGISLYSHCQCILSNFNSKIVTGSYHCSKLNKLSHVTNNSILNRMHDSNKLKRTIIRKRLGKMTDLQIEVFNETLKTGKVFVSPKGFGYRVKGSGIQLTTKYIKFLKND